MLDLNECVCVHARAARFSGGHRRECALVATLRLHSDPPLEGCAVHLVLHRERREGERVSESNEMVVGVFGVSFGFDGSAHECIGTSGRGTDPGSVSSVFILARVRMMQHCAIGRGVVAGRACSAE